MRDSYGRITPDFEAWKKLGYKLEGTHEHYYTLTNDPDNFYDFIIIACDYESNGTLNFEPNYSKEHYQFPDSWLEDFTEEEKAQIEKDIANWKKEMKK